MRVAVFFSGKGSTAKALLAGQGKYQIVALVSDTTDPEKCAIKEIAEQHKLPYLARDIKAFYAQKGKPLKDLETRKEFDLETAQWLEQHNVEVIALAGYMSLITSPLYENFITLNSHPGDLAILDGKGQRRFVGAHAVKDAILAGQTHVRTSIILVNGGIDAGPILVRSGPVSILKHLPANFSLPPAPSSPALHPRPPTPEKDGSDAELEALARNVQDELKERGDYPSYVFALMELASRHFTFEGTTVLYRGLPLKAGVNLDKEQLRAQMRARIRNITEELTKSAHALRQLASVPELASANTLLSYKPLPGEIDVSPIKTRTVLLTTYDGGIEPTPEGPIEAVLVPGLAFDLKGNRLGRGAGHYDTILSSIDAPKIGMAFDEQIVEAIPHEPHDIRMDLIVTPTQVIRCTTP